MNDARWSPILRRAATLRWLLVIGTVLEIVSAVVHWIAGLAVIWAAGTVLWHRDELNRSRDADRRLAEAERSLTAASKIHGAVVGDLSQIAIMAQVMADDATAEQRRKLELIRRRADAALRGVRDVIDYLDGNRATSSEDVDLGRYAERYLQTLSTIIRAEDARLRELGFRGHGMMRGTCAVPSPELGELSVDMVREAYANIMRHADPKGAGYRLEVSLHDGMFRLTQTNARTHTTRWVPFTPSGRGLALLAKRFAAHGGILRHDVDGEEWTLVCELPLIAASASEKQRSDALGVL